MVQIIQSRERPKKKSFAESLGLGVGRGLDTATQLLEQHQHQKAQMQAAEALGIPPEVFSLPEQAQAEFFKNQFAREKPLNALQQSQLELNQQKTKNYQDVGNLLQSSGFSGKPMEMEGERQPEESQGQSPLSNLPKDQLRTIASFAGQPGIEGIYGQMAKNELDSQKNMEEQERRQSENDRTFHTKYSQKSVEEADKLRASIPKLENAMDYARNAIESGSVGAFSMANLGEILKIPALQTAKGSQLVTASKENLLGNMSRVSSRGQNQWFEQRLNSMFPRIGQSQEANLSALEILESESAMERAYLDEFDRIQDEDIEKYGYERKDIAKRAHAAVKPYENFIFNRSNYRLKELEEREEGASNLKQKVGKNVIKGTPLTLTMASLYKQKFGDKALQVAEKNGYTIPTRDEFEAYQKRPREFRQDLSQEIIDESE
jgi:hypothetical protein